MLFLSELLFFFVSSLSYSDVVTGQNNYISFHSLFFFFFYLSLDDIDYIIYYLFIL